MIIEIANLEVWRIVCNSTNRNLENWKAVIKTWSPSKNQDLIT